MHGSITLGSLTFLAGSFARSRDLLQHLLLGASTIGQQCLYLKDLFDFFETQPSISSPPGAPEVPWPIRQGLVFEDIGFRYPGRDAWALRHVHFRLHPGERIAFVGENGAGKTTLIKLLARLYDPTEGRILLDGVDLRDYDLQSVRRAIGIIFQDFVRYDLRFDENIGVGALDELRSYLDLSDHGQRGSGAVPGPIAAAAERSLPPPSCQASPRATGRCSVAVSMAASSSRAGSGRRSRSPAPTSATHRSSFSMSRRRRSMHVPRSLPAVFAPGGGEDGGHYFASLLHSAYGRPHHRRPKWHSSRRRHARCAGGAGWFAALFALQAEGYR